MGGDGHSSQSPGDELKDIIQLGIYEDLFGDKNVGAIKLFRWGLKFVWKDKKDGFKEKQIDLRYNNRYSYRININGVNLNARRFYNNFRYKLRFWMGNDLYECIWGYGVDPDINEWYDLKNNEKNYLIEHNWFSK